MFMVEIDNDTLEKIIETHNDVKHIVQDNKIYQEKFDKLEGRVRHIENWFLPAVGVIGLFAHKFWSFLKF